MTDAFQTGRYKAFKDVANAHDPAAIAEFYHKTGVVVSASENTAVVGRAAVADQYKKFAETFGKPTAPPTFTNEIFNGAGDFIVVTAGFEATSEKVGPIKGDFIQIWRKDGGEYYIYHDEFTVAK